MAKKNAFWTEGTISSLAFESAKWSVAVSPTSDFSVTVNDERNVLLLEGPPPVDKSPLANKLPALLFREKSLTLTASGDFGDVLKVALTHGNRCRFCITSESGTYEITQVEIYNK